LIEPQRKVQSSILFFGVKERNEAFCRKKSFSGDEGGEGGGEELGEDRKRGVEEVLSSTKEKAYQKKGAIRWAALLVWNSRKINAPKKQSSGQPLERMGGRRMASPLKGESKEKKEKKINQDIRKRTDCMIHLKKLGGSDLQNLARRWTKCYGIKK